MPFCPSCGKEVLAGESFCWSCGAALPRLTQPRTIAGSPSTSGTRPQGGERNGLLAILLSFVLPGLGQYYVGEKRKGLLFMVIAVAFALAILVEIGLYLYTFFWLYNMIDSFLTVRKAIEVQPLL